MTLTPDIPVKPSFRGNTSNRYIGLAAIRISPPEMNGVSFAREGEQREERAKSSQEKNGRVVTVRETNGTTFHMENESARDSFLHRSSEFFNSR